MGQIAGDVRFRWLGAAGLVLRPCAPHGRDCVVAIDPFVTRPPWRAIVGGRWPSRPDLVRAHLPTCDQVLVTHAHYDHLMDVPAVAAQTGAVVYGSANACRLLSLHGVPDRQIMQVNVGDTLALGTLTARVLPGAHPQVPGFGPRPLREGLGPPLRLRDYALDECFGYVIEVAGCTVLCWAGGSPALAPPRADLLFAAAYLERRELAALCRATRPRLAVPIHWDSLFQPLSHPARPMLAPPRLTWPPLRRMDPAAFCAAALAASPGTAALVPERLREYNLGEWL